MTLKKLSIALSLSAAVSLPLFAQVTPIGRSTPAAAQGQRLGVYSDAEATVIATRLYRALLGREPDPEGLAGTVTELRAGRGRERIEQMIASTEFANNTNTKNADVILEQFYRGLLGRSVDPAGQARLRAIQEKRYADEAVSIILSDEFRTQLASTAGSSTAATPTPSAPAGAVTSSTVVDCQERVVEAIRNDLTGFVLLNFDAATTSGSSVTGTATDVSDNNRRLSYRCDTGSSASYTYDDGRRQRSTPAEGEFANDIVRSCQGEIRTKAMQQLNAQNVVFESAGLMPSVNDTQAVRGLGFTRSSGGRNGANFVYACDMRGTQILVSTVRRR